MVKQHQRYSLQFTVQKGEEGLLREFLLEHKSLSRKRLSKIKHSGELLVNGRSVTVRAELKEGDLVTVIFPIEESSPFIKPEPISLDIIYEDEDILLVNKPANQCVHPSSTQQSATLANGVLYYWQQKGWIRAFHAVTRLDKDTTGLTLIAQNAFAHQQLAIQQRAGHIQRRYYALVHGSVKLDQGVIEAPIGRKEGSIIEREVRENGQFARTYYQVKKRFTNYTWLELKLDTGRTHQIRVHLSHLGHPLLGDSLYGGDRTFIPRQALHAFLLSFQHPKTRKKLTFQAPLPKDMYRLVQVNSY